MLKLQSTRTNLRPFENKDLEALLLMMSDPDVMKLTGFKEPQKEEKVRELLIKWSKSKTVWAAVEKDSESLVGWFMLRKTILDAPELGFMLIKSKWGMGLATEISRCLVEYAFNTLQESKVLATTDVDNSASIKVLTKIGFIKTKSYSDTEGVLYFEILK
jgi:RimJ/RimL family protein N-acetyltransferase